MMGGSSAEAAEKMRQEEAAAKQRKAPVSALGPCHQLTCEALSDILGSGDARRNGSASRPRGMQELGKVSWPS